MRALEAAAAAARSRAGWLQNLFEAVAAEAAALWQGAARPALPQPLADAVFGGAQGQQQQQAAGAAGLSADADGGATALALPAAEHAAAARWVYRYRPGVWRAAEAALRELAAEQNPGAVGESFGASVLYKRRRKRCFVWQPKLQL